MSEPIISVSGLRGIVGESLTPETVVRYIGLFATALRETHLAPPNRGGSLTPSRPVVLIGRDSRPSGAALSRLVAGTLAAAGCDVADAGIVPTPTLGVLVDSHRAAGGVQISASHNPSPYNGFKLFSSDARVLPATAGAHLLSAYRDPTARPKWQDGLTCGELRELADPYQEHLTRVLRLVDREAIAGCRFRVLLDANAGAGGPIGRRLLEALGCDVTVLGETPDGQFLHPPEPTEANLASVTARFGPSSVESAAGAGALAGFDVGFCQDPDADRLALLDECGRYIGEEYTVALAALHLLARQTGSVVVNCSTSRMTRDVCQSFGVPLIESAVGEANVVDAMRHHGAIFGGEGNGGPIHPDVVAVRDSLTGMALTLDLLAQRKRPLSDVIEELPRYTIAKRTVPLQRERLPAALERLKERFSDAKPSVLDGLKLSWTDRWLLVRASNTEPIVRLVVEAGDAYAADAMLTSAVEAMLTQPTART